MLKTVWRGLLARAQRLALTGSVVVLAVAFIAGTVILTDSLDQAATNDVAGSAAAVDLALVPDEDPIDAALGTTVEQVPGVAAVAARQRVPVDVADGEGRLDPVGYGYLNALPTDAALANLRLVAGRAPEASGEALVDQATLERIDAEVGDAYRVFTPTGDGTAVLALQIVGVTPRSASGGGATEVGVTPETFAIALRETSAEISRVDVRLEDAADPVTVQAEIAAATGATVITGAELEHRLINDNRTLAAELQVPLLVLGAVALIAAVFVVANTFRILVAQRTRELALLRTIGASRRQVLGGVLAEALAIGLVASFLGVLVGTLGAAGLAAVLSDATMDLGALVIDPVMVGVAVIVGTAVTVLAALVPARLATRVAPLAAFRVEPDGESGRPSWARVVFGLLCAAGGGAIVVGGALLGRANPSLGLPVVVLGAALGFLGVLVLGPVIVPALIGAVGRVARRLVPGHAMAPTALAVANARRNPGRVAATTGALLIGVTMIAGFSTVVASVRSEASGFVSGAFRADLTLAQATPLPDDVLERVAALPEVGRVSELAEGTLTADVDGATLWAPMTGMDVLEYLEHTEGEVVTGSLEELTGDDTVVIDTSTASHLGVTAGATVTLRGEETAGPARDVRIVAVLSNASFAGFAGTPNLIEALDPALDGPNQLLVDVASDVDPAVTLEAVRTVTDEYPELVVSSSLAAQDAMTDGLDQAVAIVLAVLGLAVVIAIIGITNTMSLSVHERTRELGLLRALGLSRPQLRWLIAAEAALMGLVAALQGTVIGVALAYAAAISTGLTSFTVPWLVVGLCALGGGVVGIAAALVPARRAARLSPMVALAA